MIGRTLGGNYKLLDTVGAGSFASVYVARDLRTNVVVAVKVLHPQHVQDVGILERFRREAELVQRLHHPNIVRALDFGRDEDVVYLVQEYVQGHTLAEVIQSRGQLAVEEALGAIRQALEALDAASEMGVVHRDVKPHNMMLTPEGTLKVMDFGVARQAELGTMTQSGVFMGTLHYMAPEVLQGERADIRSDLYALGITLYQCLAGKVPFDADSAWALITLHVTAAPPPLLETRADLSEGLMAVVDKALSKLPADRFQTPQEMLDALAPFAAGVMPAPGVLMPPPVEQLSSRVEQSQPEPGRGLVAPGEQHAAPAERLEPQPEVPRSQLAASTGQLQEQSGADLAPPQAAGMELTKPAASTGGDAPSGSAAAHCDNCGAPLGGVRRFCATCGHAVGSRGGPQPQAAAVIEGRGAPAAPAASAAPRNIPLVPIAAAGGLLAIALLALLVVRPLVSGSPAATGTPTAQLSVTVAVAEAAPASPSATSGPTSSPAPLPPATLFALAVVSAGGTPESLSEMPTAEATPEVAAALGTASEELIATLEADPYTDTTPGALETRVAEIRADTEAGIATLEAEAGEESTPEPSDNTSIGNFAVDGWEVLPISGLNLPGDIVIDSQERGQAMYIADTENHRILQLLDTLVAGEWGSYGSGDDEFDVPVGLGIDGQGNVYVADYDNDRVVKYDIAGEKVTEFGEKVDSDAEGSFDGPSDVAVDDEGNLYVVEAENNRVQVLSPSGEVLFIVGSAGSEVGQLDTPSGIALDSAHSAMYVVDSNNHRIQRFDARGDAPTIIGSQGGGPGEFKTPARVVLDADGNLYVMDIGNARIQKISPDGEYLGHVGESGDYPGGFSTPLAGAFDAEGNLYVVDSGNSRIQRLSGDELDENTRKAARAASDS